MNQPIHPPTSKWAQHLLFWQASGRCFFKEKNIYSMYWLLLKSLQTLYFEGQTAEGFWGALQSQPNTTKVCWEGCYTFHLPFLHCGLGWWNSPSPLVFNVAFIYPCTVPPSFFSIKNEDSFIAICSGKPKPSIAFHMHLILHVAYQIS